MQVAANRMLLQAAQRGERLATDRSRIIQRVISRPNSFSDIPEPTERKLFKLGSNWKVLNLSGGDWPVLEASLQGSAETDENLLRLVLLYIKVNKDRVERLIQVSNISSDILLGAREALSTGIVSDLDEIDRQSLLILRIQAGLHFNRFSELVDYIRSPFHSEWIRKSFLHPFIYYSLNAPVDSFLDTFLSYMVPASGTGGVERQVIRHLLREDLSFETALSFRAYLALACHPFDAFDSLVSFYETTNASAGGLTTDQLATLRQLSEWFPDSRASRLYAYLQRSDNPRATDGDCEEVVALSDRVPMVVKDLISRFVEIDSTMPNIAELPNDQLKALARMRWSRYPDEADFTTVTLSGRAWAFLDAGRLYTALCTAMYMLSRESEVVETRHLHRIHALTGRSTPFIWAAPRGYALLKMQMAAGGPPWLGADLHAGASLARRLEAPDRSWFSAVHWELQKHERAVHVRKWLAGMRKYFPIKPKYLSGVDWRWLDRVLPICRIAPFRESTDGPYALLLRDTEETARDSTLLRTAIEGRAIGKTSDEFVEYLEHEFGASATAFVMYFLTAENILMLGLAPNMTAALSERISALERCAANLGFSDLLSEEQLRSEQETLTAALMLLNINANQFDVPWSAFRRDAGERQRDNFAAFQAFKRANRSLEKANEQVIPYPHVFANGKAVEYTFHASQFNLGIFVAGAIDAFYDHPSYGLEAILSTRFRHDTLRRELKAVLDALEGLHISGVARQYKESIVRPLAIVALDAVDDWLVRFMQTKRPGAPEALFDLIPDQQELGHLLNDIVSADEMDRALLVVQDWLEGKLKDQLTTVRASFIEKCLSDVLAKVEVESRLIQRQEFVDVVVMGKVLAAVTSTITRRFDELLEWFRMPIGSRQPALTFNQIKAAVDGRFEQAIARGSLIVVLSNEPAFFRAVPAEGVKIVFDLLSELYANCLKYSALESTRMSISSWRNVADGLWGCEVISDAAPGHATWSREVPGHPYISISDAIAREGNSGLHKVSSLSSTLTQRAGAIAAARLERSFAIEIPLGRIE